MSKEKAKDKEEEKKRRSKVAKDLYDKYYGNKSKDDKGEMYEDNDK